MLICAELLLVATGIDGKPLAGSSQLNLALAGGALCELAAYHKVAVKDGKLVVLDPRPGGDPLLDHALGVFAHKNGKKPDRALPGLAKGMADRTYQHLQTDGMVGFVKGGFLRAQRHPVIDTATRAALVDAGGRVLAGVARPNLHTGSLIALLAAADAVTKIYDPHVFGVHKRELTRRARAVGDQDWAAGAAAAAIKSAQEATAAAMIAVSVATGAGVVGS